MDPISSAGPLSGVKVIELGTLIAAPFAARIMADFGAQVIKVENPASPDPMRTWGNVMKHDRSLWWAVQSRNKTCIALDLKSTADKERLRGLLAEADVLIENFRPGTLERLGFAPEKLWQVNPGLVITRVSGYGQTGPSATKAGYASVAEATGGLRHLNGYPDQPPPRTGISMGDSLAALYAVQGTMMALYWRDARGGRGQVVDVSLVESSFSLLENAVPEYAHSALVPGPSGSRLNGIAPSNIYQSSDGKWVVIAANQDSVFVRLAAAVGRPELGADERYSNHTVRGAHQDELDDLIADWARQYPAEELITILQSHGVPTSTVNTIADIFVDPLFHDRQMLIDIPDEDGTPITHPGIVPKLSQSPGQIRWNGPANYADLTPTRLSDSESR